MTSGIILVILPLMETADLPPALTSMDKPSFSLPGECGHWVALSSAQCSKHWFFSHPLAPQTVFTPRVLEVGIVHSRGSVPCKISYSLFFTGDAIKVWWQLLDCCCGSVSGGHRTRGESQARSRLHVGAEVQGSVPLGVDLTFLSSSLRLRQVCVPQFWGWAAKVRGKLGRVMDLRFCSRKQRSGNFRMGFGSPGQTGRRPQRQFLVSSEV